MRTSNVRAALSRNLKDIKTLIKLHEEPMKGSAGRPPQEREVLKRAAIILIVAAWEAYIEDTIITRFQRRLTSATSSDDVNSAFSAYASRWLNPELRHAEDRA